MRILRELPRTLQRCKYLTIPHRNMALFRMPSSSFFPRTELDNFFDDVVRLRHHHRPVLEDLVRWPTVPHTELDRIWNLPTWRNEGENQDGTHNMSLDFDVNGFKPEDITLETKDGELKVEGKYEEKGDGGYQKRHFIKTVAIPKGMDLSNMSCNFQNGVMKVGGKVKPLAIEEAKKDESKKAVGQQPINMPITHK